MKNSLAKNNLSVANRFFRATLLLIRNATVKIDTAQDAPPMGVIPKSTDSGIGYDLYEPDDTPIKTFIVIHGLTLQGERDPRLICFSKALATSGVRTAAISLPALKKCRFEDKDVHAIMDLVRTLSAVYNQKIGIIGFSLGAGLGLVAAASTDVRDMVEPLILFGAYYNLTDIRDIIAGYSRKVPTNDDQWDSFIWIRLIMAYKNLESLPLNEIEKAELVEFLTQYCVETSIDRKREFYERVLKKLNLEEKNIFDVSAEVMKKLSPENKIRSITCRVGLLHDSFDRLIPWQHSEKIFQELSDRHNPNGQKMIITPLLSHVTARYSLKVTDIYHILSILGEIFR